jgi:PAS domain S-box-containing protein
MNDLEALLNDGTLPSVLESSVDCIRVLDMEGRTLFVNRATREVTGLAEGATAAETWTSNWPERTKLAVRRGIQLGLGGEATRFQAEIPTWQGVLKQWDIVIAPLRNASGRQLGLIATTRDITAAYVARHEADARNAALTRANAELKAANRVAQLGSWEYDCALRQVSFSAEVIEMINGGEAPPSGAPLTRWHDEDRQAFDEALEKAANLGQAFTFEGRMHSPQGQTRWMRMTGEPVLANGWCSLIRGACQDVTPWRESLELLQASEQKAVGAAKVMADFLSTMSHELRTPMNGVLGMAQAMSMGELSEIQRRRLQVISTAGEELMVVLNRVLTMSRLEAGKVELFLADFDAGLLSEAAAAFAPQLQGSPVSLQVNLADSGAGAWVGDALRLKEILELLVENAIKFTCEGVIKVDIDGSDEGLTLTVSDTGAGIEPQMRDAIFDKFVQGDASATRRYGGSGLGLTICRDLARLMSGDVQVTSTPGIGSTFVVSIPMTRASAQRVA